jgi:hypothetical protein
VALSKKKRSGLLVLILFCAISGLTPGIHAGESGELIRNRLAKEELKLAGTPSLYFIIALQSETISLKSRGVTLREWKISGLRAWGDPPRPTALTILKKSALFPPKRTKIKPAANEAEAAAYEPDALELKDMPSRFSLFLSDGMRIYVRAGVDGFVPRLGTVGHFFAWYVWAPMSNLFSDLRNKPYSALDIKLADKKDVQALYWAFPDGIKGLVYPL